MYGVVDCVGCGLSGEKLREMVEGGVEERKRRRAGGQEGEWEWKLRILNLRCEYVYVMMIRQWGVW